MHAGKLNKGAVAIAQSGGPSPVVNSTLVSVIRAAKSHGAKKIYGARYGIDGIIKREFYNLHSQPSGILRQVAKTPGMALGSKRKEPTEDECREIVESFKSMGVRYFFFIGGDNTARSTMLISNHAQEQHYELACFHVPKTIDNDILVTDHTPGFGSAALYVARAVLGIEMDNRALPGVHIVVTMGKDAGYLAASSVFAKKSGESGPHKIYVPEMVFDTGKFLSDVEETFSKFSRGVFVLSEGIRVASAGGKTKLLVEHLEAGHGDDGFGGCSISGNSATSDYLVQQVKEKLKISRVRGETFGYSQRSFIGCISEVDERESVIAGTAAVKYAARGFGAGSVALNSINGRAKGADDTQLASLEIVGSGKKSMPIKYISSSGTGITADCMDYISQLVGEKLPWVGELKPTFYRPK